MQFGPSPPGWTPLEVHGLSLAPTLRARAASRPTGWSPWSAPLMPTLRARGGPHSGKGAPERSGVEVAGRTVAPGAVRSSHAWPVGVVALGVAAAGAQRSPGGRRAVARETGEVVDVKDQKKVAEPVACPLCSRQFSRVTAGGAVPLDVNTSG